MAEANRGATIKEWTFASYEMHERGRSWFVAASVVAAILLIYAFFTKNFLFAVILVMVAVVLYLQKSRAPEQLSCAITEQGIVLHDRFTAYEDLKDFWVVDEAGPRGTLYIDVPGIRPRIVVPISDHDAAAIRDELRKHLPESAERDEPFADLMGRVLKL